MRLLIIRHGETVDNVEHRISGRSDCALTENGHRQAARLADRLATEHLDAIVTSPLVRAGDTATAVATHHPLAVRVDADLTEVGMGDWQNRRLADIEADHPDALARWRHHPAQNPPPGGETLAELAERAERVLRRHHTEFPDATVLWSTHGALIGVFLCRVLGMDLNRRKQLLSDNASISELNVYTDVAVLRRFNDTDHVRELLGDGLAAFHLAGGRT